MAYSTSPPTTGSDPITSGNTGAGLAAQSGESKLYQKTLEVYEQTSDFFQQFEGGRDALIRTNTDVSKGAGQTVTIRSLAGFYGEPKEGDAQFEAASDFEEFKMQDYQLKVDYIRWATRMTERSEEFMGIRGELKAGVPREAGKWLGRIKTERMFKTLIERASSENKTVANGKTVETADNAKNSLLSADTLSYDEIIAGATKLKTLGGEPAIIGTEGKNSVKGYAVIAATDSLFSLESDSDYLDAMKYSDARGRGNLRFTGGYSNLRGNMICEYNSIDHDGDGAIGSPLAPKAILGEAVTLTANGSEESEKFLKGGGSAAAAAKTGVLYFKWFDGYAYKFSEGDALAAEEAKEKYLLVTNPNSGTVHANKCNVVSYKVNDGNKITVFKASAASGDVNHVGGVHSDQAPFKDHLTTTLEVGATIVPCTKEGVPYADTLFLAKGAAVRGYGKHRNKRGTDTHEDGFVTDLYIRSVFGQAVREDAAGRKPGVLRLRHAIRYAGLPHFNVDATSVVAS